MRDVLLSITGAEALLCADAPIIAPVDIADTAHTAAITPANTFCFDCSCLFHFDYPLLFIFFVSLLSTSI